MKRATLRHFGLALTAVAVGLAQGACGSSRSEPTSSKSPTEAGASTAVTSTLTGSAALVEAARVGDRAAVERLLREGADVNAVAEPSHRETALMAASAAGRLDVVTLLLEQGADPSRRDAFKGTALLRAVFFGYIPIVRALIGAGADPNERFFSVVADVTPLIVAARAGNEDIARWLVESGANVNTRAADGKTALDYAIAGGHDTLAQFLRDSGTR